MGTLYHGICYASVSDAESQLFSDVAPTILPNGLNTLQYRNGAWWHIVSQSGQDVSAYTIPAVQLPTCNPADSVILGAELGMAVICVWVIGYAWRAMRRAV